MIAQARWGSSASTRRPARQSPCVVDCIKGPPSAGRYTDLAVGCTRAAERTIGTAARGLGPGTGREPDERGREKDAVADPKTIQIPAAAAAARAHHRRDMFAELEGEQGQERRGARTACRLLRGSVRISFGKKATNGYTRVVAIAIVIVICHYQQRSGKILRSITN